MRTLPAFLLTLTAATTASADTSDPCVVRTCDDIAALRDQVAQAPLPGVRGLAGHLGVAHQKCVEGKLAPAVAQLGAFTHQVAARSPRWIPAEDAAQVTAHVGGLIDRLRGLAEGGACIEALGPIALIAQCPLAGDLAPLTDDFGDGVSGPAWQTAIAPGTPATVSESGGALVLHSGPAPAGASASPYGYMSTCEYPAQDVAVSADLHIDAGATGEYSGQLHADGAVLYVGYETGGDHGFVSLLFADAPAPDAAAVSLPDLRGRDLRLTLTRTTVAGVQTVSGTVVDAATDEVIFADSAARAVPQTAPSRAAILGGFVPFDAPLNLATDATLRFTDYRTTLIGALPAFVGSPAPLSLDGVAYDDGGTRFLVDGQLTVLTAPGRVAGADGTEPLAAALVSDGSAHLTYYTDLDRDALALVLAVLSPGSTIDAYAAGVLMPAGPGTDYVAVPGALTAPQ